MVGINDSSVQAESRGPCWLAWSEGRPPPGAVLQKKRKRWRGGRVKWEKWKGMLQQLAQSPACGKATGSVESTSKFLRCDM